MKNGLIGNVILKEERLEDGCAYTYELIHREGDGVADWKVPLYSIRIAMTDSQGNKTEREAMDLFSDGERAGEFFQKLVRNLATPIDLGYVVEDEVRS